MEEHDIQNTTPGSPEDPPPDDLNTGPAPKNPPDGPPEGPNEAPYGRHKPYPAEHRQAILQAYAVWKGGVDEFCSQHKVYKGTLWAWRREFIKLEKAKGQDGTILPKIPAYTPEQKRQAVEAFVKSGQSLKDFSLLWGVVKTTLARWVRAYVEGGPKALENRAGRKTGRKPVPAAVRESIVKVKSWFPGFGWRKVRHFMARFWGLSVSPPLIRRVVQEEGLPHGLVLKRRWKKRPLVRKFERARPGEMWQTDITSFVLARSGLRVYLVAFMDDHSRFVVAWKLALRQTQDFVQETLLEGIQRWGKPRELLSDQGRQYFAWRGKSGFQKLLEKLGIRHVVSRAHHPETLGKCERFWETVGQEFWGRAQPEELAEAQSRLSFFINHYNFFRPHQGIGGSVPADRFFGVDDQVRQTILKAMKSNQLALAIGETPRKPVFLVGQIGDKALSLHGERGRLVLQTPQGVLQEVAFHNFGIPEGGEDDRRIAQPGTAPAQSAGGGKPASKPGNLDLDWGGNAQEIQEAGKTEVGVQDGHPAVPGEGHLGAGQPGGTQEGPRAGGTDAGALAGPDEPQRSGGQAGNTAPQSLANEPTGPFGYGGGADEAAENAGEGDTRARGGAQGGHQGPAQEDRRAAA
jgi:transposase InsO family protein/transposase-like protein